MYSRVLKNIINVTTKLRDKRDLKKIASTSSSLVFLAAKQQILTCTSFFHVSSRTSNESALPYNLPEQPSERKIKIDEISQKELNEMLAKDPNLNKLREIIKMEIHVMKQDNKNVPNELRPKHWVELLKYNRMRREKYLDFLFKLEFKRQNRKDKQQKAYENYLERRDTIAPCGLNTETMIYGVGRNTFLRRINDNTMNLLWQWNCMKAIMWGNKLIFDCSYDQYMKPQEIRSCAKQIMESYAINRLHTHPYDVYLCNVDFKGQLIKQLSFFIPNIFDSDFPWTITSKSFMEIFNKDSLVYLSGHTNNVLHRVDSSSVFIIGSFVDKSYKQPVSLAKAKELGIRIAKLPLDEYLHFGDGSNKNLTLNQVTSILLDKQILGWEESLRHVPRRKLYDSRVKAMERKLQKKIDLNNLTGEPIVEDFEIKSAPVLDFSHSARANLRKQFGQNK